MSFGRTRELTKIGRYFNPPSREVEGGEGEGSLSRDGWYRGKVTIFVLKCKDSLRFYHQVQRWVTISVFIIGMGLGFHNLYICEVEMYRQTYSKAKS